MSVRKKRFAYLSGPVDGVEVYNAWATKHTLQYFGTSYLLQFYEICAAHAAEGYVITTLSGEHYRRSFNGMEIDNRPSPPVILTGLRYHVACALWMLKLLPALLKFRPDILIITAGHNYWIFLAILKLFGVRIIPAIHDSLWKRFAPLKPSWRILRWIEAIFFATCVDKFIVAAETTAQQVRTLVPRKKIQLEVFLPTYLPQQFEDIRPSDFHARPFRAFFMGRIETNKGVFDLVEIASKLSAKEFHFDICGTGTQLASLRQTIEERGLSDLMTCHGFLNRQELYELINQTHVVIVPTTTDFEEGFNMVCAESILAGRPVITSAVCPAIYYIGDAAIEVPPNEVESYRESLLRLAQDNELYERKRSACKSLQAQFYDPQNSYAAKLKLVIESSLGTPI